MNELKRLVVTNIETGKVVVDVTKDFDVALDCTQISSQLSGAALRAWQVSAVCDKCLYDKDPIGTIKETGGYRFEFRKPEPQPDADGWIETTTKLIDCDGLLDVMWSDRSIDLNRTYRSIAHRFTEDNHKLWIIKWRRAKAEQPKPKGVREVTKTVWLDSDDCEHETERAAIESDLDGNHGLSLHVYAKPDGSSDADAIALFKRLLELRK